MRATLEAGHTIQIAVTAAPSKSGSGPYKYTAAAWQPAPNPPYVAFSAPASLPLVSSLPFDAFLNVPGGGNVPVAAGTPAPTFVLDSVQGRYICAAAA